MDWKAYVIQSRHIYQRFSGKRRIPLLRIETDKPSLRQRFTGYAIAVGVQPVNIKTDLLKTEVVAGLGLALGAKVATVICIIGTGAAAGGACVAVGGCLLLLGLEY